MFNPVEASKNIKNDFVNYLVSSFYISDDDYRNQFIDKLKSGNISKGPFVHIQQPFDTGETIDELCNQMVLSKEYRNLEKSTKKKLPLDRGLYKHQINAIDVIATKKHNAVITTGTGSGKTECFLIPVLNDLLLEKEAGTLSNPGVRAMLIYPMNALAHDQIKRLREILKDYPEITFGVYNGNTKQKESEARADYLDANGCEPPENEYISRDLMNKKPPHILCTNYAMLEHMLLKPDNAKIFENNKFKFIILDEAHVYSGATGMENALLLRRLKARISRGQKIQFILTSATLGQKGKDEKDIINFANSLTGEEFFEDDIVFGTRQMADTTNSTKAFDSLLFEKLANSEVERHKEILNDFGIVVSSVKPETYYDLCKSYSLYKNICSLDKLIDIEELANNLKFNLNDLINFLNVVCLASKNGIPLLDLKYHFFIRGLEGIYSPLIDKKEIIFEKKTHVGDINIFERAICKNCGNLGIAGIIKKRNDIEYLEISAKFDESEYYSIFDINEKDNLFFEEDVDDIVDDGGEIDEIKKDDSYKEKKLCPKCGSVADIDEELMCDCENEPKKIIYKPGTCRCARCKSGNLQKVFTNQENSTSILATSLFDNIPTKESFGKDYYGNKIRWDGGKQFLCFSDSRSDAAFFAPYLSNYQSEFIWKRAIIKALEKIDEEVDFDDFVKDVNKVLKNNESFSVDLSEDNNNKKFKELNKKNAIAAIINELINSRDKNSLMSYGLLDFKINNKNAANKLSEYFLIDENKCLKLLDYLIMFFAWNGCIQIDELDDDQEVSNNLKQYLFFTENQKMICKQKESAGNGIGWMAKYKPGKTDEFFNNSRTEIVERVLGFDTKKANEFLDKYLQILDKNGIIKRDGRKDEYYYLPVDNFIILPKEETKFFKCKKCGKITTHNLDGICNEHRCGGKLFETDYKDLFLKNEFAAIYNNENLKHMLIKEHTAQLSNKEGHEYQKMFEKNKIHALSCSTTFEMGVDVGELETVFLRNVPPTAANYAQRAGRAGRSKDAAAYCLCFAKLSSHDYNYFNNPEKIIIGNIIPPVFKIDNEKIVDRHVYAIMFGYFFQKYNKYFKAQNFLLGDDIDKIKGYEIFKKMLKSKPVDLIELLEHSIPSFTNIDSYISKLVESNGILENSVMEFLENIKTLEKLKKDAAKSGDTRQEERYLNMLKNYKAVEMIDFLVTNNVIPKYGFPIDSVSLNVRGEKAEKSLNLSRSRALAISEYAPGENVIANGKVYESRYINKSYINDGGKPKLTFFERTIGKCPECNTYNYFEIKEKEQYCNVCGSQIKMIQDGIVPKKGFTSSSNVKPVKMKKPDKKYSSQGHYIPDENVSESIIFNIKGKDIELKTTLNDRIMNVSNDDFYVCNFCGYSVTKLDKKEFKTDKETYKKVKDGRTKMIDLSHKGLDYKSCLGHLYKRRLIDIYNTDVLVMNFGKYASCDYDEALSVLYGLLDAISEVLSIERSDINGTLFSNFEDDTFAGYQLVFYDTVPGGAGNVKLLLKEQEKLEEIFNAAYKKLKNCKCSNSCYNCLNNYSNQRYHDKLSRNLAIDFIEKFI